MNTKPEKKSFSYEFFKGIIKDNPVLVLLLGTCPALAVTTGAMSGFHMGLATTAVLIGSNIVISLIRRFIPQTVRIPAFITVIAGFVTIVQLLVRAYAPEINETLGLYLPLIVVNCIILGRAEAFASKNGIFSSIADGAGMGIGFTAALVLMGLIREILGSGKVFGYELLPGDVFTPIMIFAMPAGGFFVYGMLIALSTKLQKKPKKKTKDGCAGCPAAGACGSIEQGGEGDA